MRDGRPLQQTRIRLRRDGTVAGGDPTQNGPKVDLPPSMNPTTPRPRLPRLAKPRERTADLVVTDLRGRRRGRLTDIEAAIPSWLPVVASEFDKPYTLASWDPENVNPDGSTGCVYLNNEHPAVVALVTEMARAYAVTATDVAAWGRSSTPSGRRSANPLWRKSSTRSRSCAETWS